MSFLKGIFGETAKATVSGVLDGAANIIGKLKADPTKVIEVEADLAKLKIDAENKASELAVRMEEVTAKEMDSARNREIQIATSENAPLLNKIVQPVIAIIVIVSTIVIWALILFRNYEPKTNEAMIIGSLTTLTGMVLSYYFGSSTGSHAKQKQLDKMIK